ncbi:MAG TPA: RagB/SusD family nutrient uptake outer membrane protein [Leeuwenhoekiella sp.]|nr:RagB/SusD family nutrient uptake outer membrane protein [Leeuwenhoekiella sp.]
MKIFKANKLTAYKIILASLAVFALGCSDDYLDVEPEGSPTLGSGYFQGDNVQKALNACYSHEQLFSQHSFSFAGVFSIASDDADKGSAAGDTGTDKDKLDNFTHDPTDVSVSGLWNANYQGVAKANTGINIINDPVNEIEDGQREALEAEFRFFRAYHYWTLVRVFGGVPIVTEETDPEDNETLLTRKTSDETYEFIFQDLEYAAARLPQVAPQPGRVTSGTALTLLAKAHMYQSDWQEVLEYTNQVIASGQYALHPNYEELWRIQNENTEESIFEIQGSSSENLPINNLATIHGVRGQWGWGFNVPSESLLEAYNDQNDTVRRDATIIFRGEVMYDNDLYEDDDDINAVVSADAPNPRYSEKMYTGPITVDAQEQNLIILRYADVLLMNAEANNELGNISEAIYKLNMIRNRVNLPQIQGQNQAELQETIWKERRLEFGMEFDRYFDVIRQGRGQELFGPLGFQQGKHEVFPIPQDQINLSGGLLEQNPGY